MVAGGGFNGGIESCLLTSLESFQAKGIEERRRCTRQEKWLAAGLLRPLNQCGYPT